MDEAGVPVGQPEDVLRQTTRTEAWIQGIWGNLLAGETDAPGLPLNVHSTKYANALIVKSGDCIIFGFSAYSSAVAAQFIQLHEKQSAPATGDAPSAVFTVGAASHLAVSYIFPGRWCNNGCWLVNSSTGPTYTPGAADTYFDAQFI